MPLSELIRAGMEWPPPVHADRIEVQEGYARLARNRRHELVQHHNLDLMRYVDAQEDVIPFPSVRIAARTFAAFLFGEDPDYSHENDDVAEALRTYAQETNLTATLLGGAYTQSVEGEVYLRPTWDQEVDPDHAILSVIPGSRVIPIFRYGHLVEAAVVTTYVRKGGSSLTGAGQTHYRLIEIYTRGRIERRLYSGSADRLGGLTAVDAIPETQGLEEAVETGIDHLGMIHVPAIQTDLNTPHGVSLFDGLEGMALALHRLYSQDQHDGEMSRRRVAVSEEFIRRDGAGHPQLDRRLDLFVMTEEAAGAVGAERAPVTPIEFSDDLVMTERVAARFRDFLIACGISPDTVDSKDTGGAISGTSRRLAQAMTIQTASAIGRYWQHALARALTLVLEIERVHLGADHPAVDGPPQVTLADGFVDDPVEEAQTIQTLDSAQAISAVQKVRRLHPEWTDDQVDEEVTAIGGLAFPPAPENGLPPGVRDLGATLRRGTRREGQAPQDAAADASASTRS